MAPVAGPEPMNTTASHAKIRVGVTLPKESVVAGGFVTGKMEVESKSDKLALGIVMVELFGFQELTSRDHSARMTFLHTRRLFQGPGLPPSNAVYAYPLPEDPPFPEDYYKAKRGHSTFLFRIPLPFTSPASIDFAGGLARVRYEVRASIGIFWKGDKVVVVDKSDVGVVESFQEDLSGAAKAEEGVVVVGEAGRFWMHGRVVGGMLVAGESACVELQVKNHSSRKNTGLTLSLHRTLLLPNTNPNAHSSASPLQISDTILTVPYKGPEYILPPGGEGVAHLVFDVPISARSVHGGTYKDGADSGRRTSEALFCIQANVEVKVNMGLGSKDIVLDVPVTIVHPDALPDVPPPQPQPQPQVGVQPQGMVYSQYTAAPPSGAPGVYSQPYIDPQTHQVWIPHPQQSPYHPYYPTPTTEGYYPQQQFYPHPHAHIPQPAAYTNILNLPPPRQLPPRPSSAGPLTTSSPHVPASGYEPPISGLPIPMELAHMPHHVPLLPLPISLSRQQSITTPPRNSHLHTNQNTSMSPHSPTTPHHSQHQRQHEDISPQALGMGASPSQAQVPGKREEGKGAVAMRISRHLRQSSVVNGRGRSVSPVAHRFGYPGVPVLADAGGSGEESDELPTAAGAQCMPTTPERADAQADTLLHSPRPQIKHKQSFTKIGGDGKVVVKSERVLELEKIAAGLDGSSLGDGGLLQGSLGRVDRDGGKDKEKEGDANVNKTLPVPPPATKSRKRFGGRQNGTGPSTTLESLFEPLYPGAATVTTSPTALASVSAAPTSPNMNLPSPLQPPTENYQTPPTPTLVAFKRPPRLGLEKSVGGCGESGLDALERRLISQVGTHKAERARPADVRDVLSGGVVGGASGEPAASVKSVTPDVAGTGTGRSASASISASSEPERMQDANDESAISSLTLDRSSSVSEDAQKERQRDGEKERREREMNEEREREREREDEEQEQEQESVDGGKTHRAGKSVVGVESYFQGRNNHRRERAGVEPIDTACTVVHANVNATTTATTPNVMSRKKVAASVDKSNKSAKARGRVAAWLGNIDPGVPPPQEEIIPPSPSVVRSLYLDGEGDEERETKEDSPIPPPAPVSILSTKEPEQQPLELQSPMVAAVATPSSSPNPRSSGFMPIGTMQTQRDTISDSMTRSMIRRVGAVTGREMTVVREARKVMDLWSEELPPPSPSATRSKENWKEREKEKEERKVPQWPFMAHIPPKAQTIRTDRRVSPPSVSAPPPGALGMGMANLEPSEPEPGPRPSTVIAVAPPTLAPGVKPNPMPQPKEYPKSYANVAKKNSNPRLPVFPPPPRQEVKYDIRSARGGRGGKVTHVASLWASVAAGNAAGAGPSVMKPSESRQAPPAANGANIDTRKAGAPLLLPKKPPPSVSPHTTTVTSTGVPQAKPVPQSKTPTPTSDAKARRKATTPTPPPRPPSSSKPTMVMPLGQTRPKLQRPELPPSTSASTPAPVSRPMPNLARKPQMKGTTMPAPMTKSPSVPALVSSSLATPMLSSTASLVRPVGSSASKTYTVAVGMPGIGRGDYKNGGGDGGGTRGVVRKKSGLGVVGEEGGSRAKPLAKERKGPTSARAVVNGASGGMKTGAEMATAHGGGVGGGEDDPKQPPPRNTAFGQARLRDLIKKYQGGNA